MYASPGLRVFGMSPPARAQGAPNAFPASFLISSRAKRPSNARDGPGELAGWRAGYPRTRRGQAQPIGVVWLSFPRSERAAVPAAPALARDSAQARGPVGKVLGPDR